MDVQRAVTQAASATSPWDRRQNNFDALRLVLALLVIYSHAFPLASGSERMEPLARLTHGQVTGGALAVNCFFVMSGLLIAASAVRSRSVLAFLAKRVQRIYPGFVAAALLCLLVFLPLSGGHLDGSTAAARCGNVLLATLRLREFGYHGAFQTTPYPGVLNGSVWSIAYEFWCYLGVAGLLVCGLLARRITVAALFALSWLVSILFRVEGWVLGGKALGLLLGPPQIWARLLPLYLAGVVFFLFRQHLPLSWRMAAVCAVAMAAACLVPYGWTVIFPFAGTYLLFFVAYCPALRLPRVGRFGDFSYGTYLYAFPVEQLVMARVGHPIAPALLFALAVPPTLLLAVVSWFGVERVFLRPARRHEDSAAMPVVPVAATSSAVS